MKRTKRKFRSLCLKCGKEEKDAFLGSCFSCWTNMTSKERKELKGQSRGSPLRPVLSTFAAAPV